MTTLSIIIVLSSRINLSSYLDVEPKIVHTPVELRYPSSETWGLQMTIISARIIRTLVFTGLLCLSFLATSCSHLEKIVDDLFSDRQQFQKTTREKEFLCRRLPKILNRTFRINDRNQIWDKTSGELGLSKSVVSQAIFFYWS